VPLGPILSDVLDVLVMLLAPSFASGKICCGPMGSRMIQVQQTYLAVKLPEVVASAVKDHWRQGGPVLPMPMPLSKLSDGAAVRCPESGRAGRA
jgi:hypothetical protein